MTTLCLLYFSILYLLNEVSVPVKTCKRPVYDNLRPLNSDTPTDALRKVIEQVQKKQIQVFHVSYVLAIMLSAPF